MRSKFRNSFEIKGEKSRKNDAKKLEFETKKTL